MERRLIAALMAALLLVGCRIQKPSFAPPAPLVLNDSDSILIETLIETCMVPVSVSVMLPQQSETKVTASDSSHVETDIAESDAWLNPDGTLGHSIRNKSTTLNTEVMVPKTSERNNREAVKIREVPVPQPYEVEVERKLTLMEQLKLRVFWPLLAVLLAAIAFIIRKPLLRLLWPRH